MFYVLCSSSHDVYTYIDVAVAVAVAVANAVANAVESDGWMIGQLFVVSLFVLCSTFF